MLENVGHFKILNRIAVGRLGELYRARDTRLGRTVALRLITADIADEPSVRPRFLHDARLAAVLSHPHITALYEVVEESGLLALVFEFVPGDTLARVVGGRPLNPRRAVDLAAQIADALAEAHAGGFVHGGLTTDRVMVSPKGHAKVLDMGLVAWIDGTGQQIVDDRTDTFALGSMLFEMLTGELPGARQEPALPPALTHIVHKSRAGDPDDRYESAAVMAAELRAAAAILETRMMAADVPPRHVPAAQQRRSGLPVAVWIVGAIVLAGLGAVWAAGGSLTALWQQIAGVFDRR